MLWTLRIIFYFFCHLESGALSWIFESSHRTLHETQYSWVNSGPAARNTPDSANMKKGTSTVSRHMAENCFWGILKLLLLKSGWFEQSEKSETTVRIELGSLISTTIHKRQKKMVGGYLVSQKATLHRRLIMARFWRTLIWLKCFWFSGLCQ